MAKKQNVHQLASLSAAEVSFVFPFYWGVRRGEIKRAGAGEIGKRKRAGDTDPSHRPQRAPDFLLSLFSLSFPVFSPFPHRRSLCGGERVGIKSCAEGCGDQVWSATHRV